VLAEIVKKEKGEEGREKRGERREEGVLCLQERTDNPLDN